ncbi:unnamed protein product [Discula destructiva]
MASVLRKFELEAKLKDENLLIASGVLRDENPLEQSLDFTKFLQACRKGDLKTCQELMNGGVNINGKDHFDYTPLIIASLCGHFELVQLLLEAGALAERNTFQGERAVYNALNDKIRNLLLSYDYSKSTDPLQPWSSHITSLLTRQIPSTADITLTSGPHELHLHKFLLSSRTPYFRTKLMEAPETRHWKVSQAIPAEAFRLVARYLYLGELPRDVGNPRSATSEEEIFKGIDKLSKQLEIEKVWEAMLSLDDRRLARQRYQDEVTRAQQQIQTFFRESVLGHKMIVDTKKVNDIKWQLDNSIYADCLLRADEYDGEDESEGDEQELVLIGPNGIPIGPASDAASVNKTPSRQRKSVVYPVHKAMLIRSPYFEAMFSSEFVEARQNQHLHITKMDCTPEVLEIILTFMYTETADVPLELGLELLYAADMLLMDRLKTKAAVAISTLGSATNTTLVDRTHTSEPDAEPLDVEPINVYDVMHAAWDLRVQRLEEFGARYLAYRLEDYIDEPEFADLINESASRLKKREETDTIELLDDIRYYLSERFRLRFEDAGLDDMLDDEGEIKAEVVEDLVAADEERLAADKNGITTTVDQSAPAAQDKDAFQASVGQTTGIVRTLEGEEVTDEFELDARNYQILLGKIDTLLERLKLDA